MIRGVLFSLVAGKHLVGKDRHGDEELVHGDSRGDDGGDGGGDGGGDDGGGDGNGEPQLNTRCLC